MKGYILLIIIPIIFILCFIMYNLLPIEIRYSKEIERGNLLIDGIEKYYQANNFYPIINFNNGKYEWKILKTIYYNTILKNNEEFSEATQPYYESNGKEYRIHYVFGFDGSYLFYSSDYKKWEYR